MKLTFSNFLLLLMLFFGINCISLTYTDIDNPKTEMDEVIDRWHRAAATGDSAAFFGLMTTDAIYLGTDEKERWDRTSMAKDLGKYFNGKKAWKFIPYNRIFMTLEDKKTMLFDECLNTWMGPCKATGKLSKVKGKWLISYYNLSVAVSNDVVKQYLTLLPSDKILKD